MLNFANLSLRRGSKLLFEGATFTVYAGQKVGITGGNGTGKSSLFALVRGELHADTGDLVRPADMVIAHVAQESPATDRPAIEYVIDGDTELRGVEAALQAAEAAHDGHRQAELHGRLDAVGGYQARARAAKLMHGLGFRPDEDEKPVASFSGGWRMRLNLAQALMCRSDLLLLDEPTNHLDLDAVMWLEDWLEGYPGTLLLISHDRDFLDAVVDHVAHLEGQRITLYAGNYSAFEQQRAAQLATQQAAYERQQREIVHIQRFVDRFRAKATKARQAQSRLKALERMELIAPAHVDSPFHFSFRPPERVPNPLLRLEQVAVGYGERAVLTRVGLSLVPGERIGLLGPNGAGKSTLIKLLAGELAPLAGQCEPAKELEVGYFAQHQLEQLDAEASPLLHLQRLDRQAPEQALRDFLGAYGFQGERIAEPVAPLSGGEKARLVLALLIYQRPNLLLLDEPTNHLDLEMRYALTLALQDYEGAVVLVSHDRHLLRTVCDELLLVADGRVEPFAGDLTDYRRWLTEHSSDALPEASAPVQPHSADGRKERRRQEAERRRQLQPLRERVRRLEAELERLGVEKAELERQLADPALYDEQNKPRLKGALQRQADVERRLAAVEVDWMAAAEALESAEAP